jgi:hypothetical protein
MRSSSLALVLASLSCSLATACAGDDGRGDDEAGTTLSGGTSSDSSGSEDMSASGPDDASDMPDGSADDASEGNDTVKFDVEWNDSPGVDTEGVPGPGSCRASEIYGASGAFPAFEDPAYANFLDRSVAIVTHNNYDGPPNDFSLTIVDISGDPPPPNANYLAPLYHHPSWTISNLGKHFGLTLDSQGNIYLAASTVWGPVASPGAIKRIDAVTGEITVFASLPNNGPAFGNINYDCVSESLYVSNHEDGRIYQLDMDGDVVSTYKHSTGDVTMGPANDPGEPDGQFAPKGERPWAVQSHAGRLYYSVWAESPQKQSVWSVAYVDQAGVPDPATATKEFDMQDQTNEPLSDLGFAHDGWMLVAQRTMWDDMSTGAHASTTFDYEYQNGQWVWQGTNYVVGELLPYSAAGGVDHDFVENGYVWMTGDALDFYTPDCVYGLQGTPYGGGGIENSTLIDLDHEITQQDKTVYGDVELPIPGDVTPVPPPVG